MALICAIVLPSIYLIYPSILKTTRTSYLLLVCLICAANLGYISIQFYLINGKGQIILPFHLCRSIVYFSSFAKPFGLYLTCLFSFERLLTKFFFKFFSTIDRFRQWTRTIFTLMIFFSVISIVLIRFYQVLNLIHRVSVEPVEPLGQNTNVTDPNMTFKSCFASMNTNRYATFLSFYVLQYWYEYVAFILILINLCLFLFFQCRSSNQQWSVNTRFYLILSIYLINAETLSTIFHLVVDDTNNIYHDIQLTGLEILLQILNLRCFSLPLIIGLVMSMPLKAFFIELFFTRPFLSQMDENDRPTSNKNRTDDREHLHEEDFSNDI